MLPQHIASPHVVPKQVKKKKVITVKYGIRQKKKFSVSYYIKQVLWKALRRYWKKRHLKNKQKHLSDGLNSSQELNKGSSDRIGIRDFWGSKYGSHWFLTKRVHDGRHRLVEIIDAFNSADSNNCTKYSNQKQEYTSTSVFKSSKSVKRTGSICKSSNFETLRTCPYVIQCSSKKRNCPGSVRCSCKNTKTKRDSSSVHTDSDWSMSTLQLQRRSYSRWPPSRPSKLVCANDQQSPLVSVLSRLNTYVYNWLYMDQMQSLCKSRVRLDLEKKKSRHIKPLSLWMQNMTLHHQQSARTLTKKFQKRIQKDYQKKQSSVYPWAKERAAILWLLSKAYNGSIPGDVREPFYRDHENQDRLKPQIVHSLANAELYCLALVNIYADPNYHNLNHHGVIQALMRKGICLIESRDSPLTETVLVQTAPIRMNAHMAVIDGIMSLYIKEVLIPEKIVEVVRGFSRVNINSEMPSNPEEAAVLWINKCCTTLQEEIKEELKAHEKISESQPQHPVIPVLQEISDISDGCSLAAVISFYCPNYIHWKDVCWNEPMSLGDSIYNLQLVKHFCCDNLPRDIHFLTLEDFLYLHPSIKDNVLAFVADLLYLFVIWPADCVTRPVHCEYEEPSQTQTEAGSKLQKDFILSHKTQQQAWSPIPNLRADAYGGSTSSLPDMRVGPRSSRSGPKEKLLDRHLNSRKSSLSTDTLETSQLHRTSSADVINGCKSANLSQSSSASSAEINQRHQFSDGRDSHPVHFSDDGSGSDASISQVVINNSRFKEQEPSLHSSESKELRSKYNMEEHSDEEHCTRSKNHIKDDTMNPRESSTYCKRKFTNSPVHGVQLRKNDNCNKESHPLQGRQSAGLEDYYNQLATEGDPVMQKLIPDVAENKNWKNSIMCDKFIHKNDSVSENAALESLDSYSSGIYISDDNKDAYLKTSFAQLSKLRDANSNAINIVYMQHDRDDLNPGSGKNPLKSSFLQKAKQKSKGGEEKRATFAALPNTTTWQQQHAFCSNSPQTDSGHETPTETNDASLNAQLCNVRMKLEERRRKIEQEKRRMESLWKRQRQKLGKAAFLQAVSKGGGSDADTPDSGTGKDVGENESPIATEKVVGASSSTSPSIVRRMSIQEIADDLDTVKKKWLDENEMTIAEPRFSEKVIGVSVETEAGDSETMNVDDFQTSIEQLNTSLNDLQADISRITFQQDQIQKMMRNSVENQMKDTSHFFLHSQHPQSDGFSVKDSLHWGEASQQPLRHSLTQESTSLIHQWPQSSREVQQQQCYNQGISFQTVSSHPSFDANEHQMNEFQFEKQPHSVSTFKNETSHNSGYHPREYLHSNIRKIDNSPKSNLQKQPYTLSPNHGTSHPVHDIQPSGVPFSTSSFVPQINQEPTSLPFKPAASAIHSQDSKSEYTAIVTNNANQDHPCTVKQFHKTQVYSPKRTPVQSTEEQKLSNKDKSKLHPKNASGECDKGFYISFDDQPRKPKPKLKAQTLKSQQSAHHIASITGDSSDNGPSSSHKAVPEKDTSEQAKTDADSSSYGFVIGADLVHPDPDAENEMARKKEMIMMLSLRRRADQETKRIAKEQEYARLREQEQRKRDYQERKKEEERSRRQAILEQYRQRKLQEELEKEGGTIAGLSSFGGKEHGSSGRTGTSKPKSSVQAKKKDNRISFHFTKPAAELTRCQVALRKQSRPPTKPRPKSAYVITGDSASLCSTDSRASNNRNSQFLFSGGDGHDFDTDSLNSTSTSSSRRALSPSSSSCQTSPTQGISCPSTGLVPGAGMRGHDTGPSSDGASDTASTTSSAIAAEYTGPKLFVKPTAKSNRGIITNAINTVLAGAVNSETKRKVLEEINRSESKHFLILFRDAGCQFRAIYSYNPDREEVLKMYGIGPKAITDKMMDRFYKYNSGGKCFSEVQTKHLTVTIDAFTIPNSLWAGKKVIPPRKEFF